VTKRKAGTAARTGGPDLTKPGGGPAAGDGPAVGGGSDGGGGSGGGPVVGAGPVIGDGPVIAGGPDLSKASAGGPGSAEAGVDVPQTGFTVPDTGFTVPDVVGDEPRPAGRSFDTELTIAGLVVAVLLAVVLAVTEAFLAPLHVSDLGFSGPGEGNMRIPLSLVLALVTNPLLGWFAFATTGRRFAALLPAAAWCVVWILAAGRTTEGDLLITNDNWVGLLTLFSGPLAFAVGIYVSTLRHRVAATANSKATPLAPRSVDR
jgi:hypothetical protein